MGEWKCYAIGMAKQQVLKTAQQMERHIKGIANHHRIAILFLVARQKDLSVEEIADHLGVNMKTIAEHTNRLTRAGLVAKRYQGHCVLHSLTPYGKQFISFLTSFQSS